ncbi:hypothetical protein FNF29_07982 [Cafeteria roenbergensis]|uniref:Uncharacterized protein n=1 Tax=Cafeteria roenbergensis TaxID=33653 RepID=A0A5A8C1G1_CAFRO|nr:hypothetical protein FNF29_07982 [Cafeteria roenbergensis]|eukprot:KAA0146575.1 hypothetical protein FNF29_07982 [Cafeteria roenbergensis]
MVSNFTRNVIAGAAEDWPVLTRPGSEPTRHAGSTHAGGFRGLPGLPSAETFVQARPVASLQASDEPLPFNASAPACRSHAHNASRTASTLLDGEVAIVVESWFTPSAYPPPCCTNVVGWWATTSALDFAYRPHCPGQDSLQNPGPLIQNSMLRESDVSQAGFGSILTATFKTAESGFQPFVKEVLPTISTLDPDSKPGQPDSAATFGPTLPGERGWRYFIDRPHQILTLYVVNVSRLGLVAPGSELTSPGQSKLLFPQGAAWNASQLAPILPLYSHGGTWVDGATEGAGCQYSHDASGFSVRPKWTERNPEAFSPPTSMQCFGGHNTTCDVMGLMCGSVGEVVPLNWSSPRQRECLSDAILGSLAPLQPLPPALASWQTGYASFNVWFKPCQACGPAAAIRSGGDPSAPLPACDLQSCLANITRVIQSRAVSGGAVPSPALLAGLRRADGGAFQWYRCSPTQLASFLSGYPVCTPECADERGDHRGGMVPWLELAGGPGRLAVRHWMTAWTGPRASARLRAACVDASAAMTSAVASGRLGVFDSHGRLEGSGRTANRTVRALLSPLLSSAWLEVTLEVPAGELLRTTQAALLLGVASEAGAVTATAPGCLVATCVSCPAAADSRVWANASVNPATGQPRPPARPTPLVPLTIRLTWLPLGVAMCVAPMPADDREWLIDARTAEAAAARAARADPAGSDPVAFTGLDAR